MVTPSTKTSPPCAGRRPRIVLKSVVLPEPLGPSRPHHLAGSDLKVDIPSNRFCAIAEAQPACGQYGDFHDQPSRPRANSHRKKGAPITAVRMPIGTSMRAMVRANVSTSSEVAAPEQHGGRQ